MLRLRSESTADNRFWVEITHLRTQPGELLFDY